MASLPARRRFRSVRRMFVRTLTLATLAALAVTLHAEQLVLAALRFLAELAELALAAEEIGLHGHAIPDMPAAHLSTNFRDDTGHFAAGCPG